MSGGLEAAGDALTGGVIARAVEPRHGEDAVGADGLTHEQGCLNCATVLVGSYCHACGQHAHIHRTLFAIGHDILHGVFHFEGKLWRTLPMLAWKPGDLTRRYIHGQRARFVSPLALFLFTVFLMFAAFESVGGPIRLKVDRATMTNGVKIDVTDFDAELAKTRALVADLERQRRDAVAKNGPVAAIDEKLGDARDDVNGLTAASAMVNGVSPEALSLPDNLKVDTGSKAFDNKVRDALKNPKLLLYKLQSSAYKFAWALIPLSLPFMWLIFAWKRQYKLYDHAVFVTYSLSFVMVLLVAMALLAATGMPTAWAFFLVPIHMFRQLKQAYLLGWLGAMWRTVTLVVLSSVVLTLFGTALLAMGLLG
ncbi:DUF3667 domain-containing protein [Sphingomonas sp. SUN039]|uniref:DUF3667 domain-containing protein n=1 Tax=Sphingomonas sp. SUN039 TaxID=2937787 RepID=UPI002164DEF4|nr:DUF3667 domain-containing protein [Sphingomonas sp. SUN039]UVO55350.1 DUF3667 domain-containing protein [Sphingomonas sp. SUN039]